MELLLEFGPLMVVIKAENIHMCSTKPGGTETLHVALQLKRLLNTRRSSR
jgi:hypothetical protein